ncbi:hypothetical protein [Collimonas humicola]|uniref:hypothetical protein n=1 Tax=Collimonas humicola TaxID=2825886 RepID=UPI001B8D76B9|nr:hypothetical protein [Collimonas humicola]
MRRSRYNEREFVELAWRYRIHVGPRDHALRERSNWQKRVRTVGAVYRCTLRLLGRWIAQFVGWSNEQLWGEMRVDRGMAVAAYPPALLALLCMRWQLERRYTDFPDFWTCPLDRAQLDDVPIVQTETFRDRQPRLAWRAIFLAIYASWYHRVSRARNKELSAVKNQHRIDECYIFARNSMVSRRGNIWHEGGEVMGPDEAWFNGKVCFLRVEGMPMAPWDRVRHGGTERACQLA